MKPTSLLLFFFCFILTNFIVGQTSLPNAAVTSLDGQKIDIAEYIRDGKPKIISLWATWCGPCRMELNALKKVYPKWKEAYDVEIVAITVDYPSMLGRAKKMFVDNDWDYTFFHDKDQELMSKLGIQGIPYSLLLDGSGQIHSVQMGYFPGYEKALEKKLKAL